VSFSARDDLRLQNFIGKASLIEKIFVVAKIYWVCVLLIQEDATGVRPDGWTHYMFFLRGDEGKLLKKAIEGPSSYSYI
jgi:hypothetical protein